MATDGRDGGPPPVNPSRCSGSGLVWCLADGGCDLAGESLPTHRAPASLWFGCFPCLRLTVALYYYYGRGSCWAKLNAISWPHSPGLWEMPSLFDSRNDRRKNKICLFLLRIWVGFFFSGKEKGDLAAAGMVRRGSLIAETVCVGLELAAAGELVSEAGAMYPRVRTAPAHPEEARMSKVSEQSSGRAVGAVHQCLSAGSVRSPYSSINAAAAIILEVGDF
jgi:hypothetical protein